MVGRVCVVWAWRIFVYEKWAKIGARDGPLFGAPTAGPCVEAIVERDIHWRRFSATFTAAEAKQDAWRELVRLIRGERTSGPAADDGRPH